jgi:hypothetical protein
MVWVAVLTTILSITGVILVSTKIFQTNSASGLLANTLLSICQSVVDQPSSFRKHKALSLKSILWMLTTWHFLSMVLSNYYKSKLLCAFVQPILVSSPKTLISLVEQSELKINTLWYSGYIEDVLGQINNSLTRNIQARVNYSEKWMDNVVNVSSRIRNIYSKVIFVFFCLCLVRQRN